VDHNAIKSKLLSEREALNAVIATSQQASQPVELDQSRVGRLSRMDAMQAQAMSLETKRRREIQLTRIDSALQRLANDEFGECVRCGEAIESKRLDFDPSVLLCIECATEADG
jgi:DnaK suppressor protein